MQPLRPSTIARALRILSVCSLAFAGCTCGPDSASAPPAAAPRAATAVATAPPATPPPAAVPPTDPPPPTAAPNTPDGSAAAAPADAPPPVDDETLATCDGQIAVLLGQKADAGALEEPAIKELAAEQAELVTCGAVWRDSADFCKLAAVNAVTDCRETTAVFHELRANAGKRTFVFTDEDWQRCRGVPALVPACDAIRAALRSGNAADCGQAGGAEGICRAYLTLDRSQCDLTGELAQAEFSLPDVKEGEPASIKIKEAAIADCRRKIERRTVLDQGLEQVAASGPLPERELARAALRRADACEAAREAARAWCGERHRPTPNPEAGASPVVTPLGDAPRPPAEPDAATG